MPACAKPPVVFTIKQDMCRGYLTRKQLAAMLYFKSARFRGGNESPLIGQAA
jgi:hypothetical protein